jgi:hypothetical protein
MECAWAHAQSKMTLNRFCKCDSDSSDSFDAASNMTAWSFEQLRKQEGKMTSMDEGMQMDGNDRQ